MSAVERLTDSKAIDRNLIEGKYLDELRTIKDCHLNDYGITPRQIEAEIRAKLLSEILGIKDKRPFWERC